MDRLIRQRMRRLASDGHFAESGLGGELAARLRG
jgi:hypothetical protein